MADVVPFPASPARKDAANVQRIYEHFLRREGPSAKRVGWNSTEAQRENFEVVLNMMEALLARHPAVRRDSPWRSLSIHDAGCGTGDLLNALNERGGFGYYLGTDFVAATLEEAKRAHPARSDVTFAWVDLLNSPVAHLPNADVTLCFGALAFHMPRDVEAILHRLWNASRFGLGFVTWWNLTPDYVYFEHMELLRKCVNRFLRESRARHIERRSGDYGDPTEAAFALVK